MRLCIDALALVAACAAETYTSNKGIDINALVKNLPEFRKFTECFVEKTECSARSAVTECRAAAAKKEFPDALSNGCAKCKTEKKHAAKIFFKSFKENFPTEYDEMRKIYDANNTLLPVLLAAVADA